MFDVVDYRSAFLSLPVAFALYRTVVWVRGLKDVCNLPGIRCLVEPLTFLGAITPEFWLYPGLNFQWAQRKTLYKRYGTDTVSVVPLLAGSARVWTANLDVMKQIVAGGPSSPWAKSSEFTEIVRLWGRNVLAAEGGELWRRHRRIMGPAFNNKTYALVWNETLRIYRDMIAAEGWDSGDVIEVPEVQKYTYKLAIFIIAACGFGLPFSWNERPAGADGNMSLQEALDISSKYTFIRVVVPRWFWKLPIAKLQYIDESFRFIEEFMKTQHEIRRKEIRQEINETGISDSSRNDVFSRLVLANESDTEKLPLDAEELIGNTFVLLFAGHETTGSTLAATLGFLGIYLDEQDIVYEQIMEVVGRDREPTVEDYPALYKVLSAFYEALRLIPAASVLIRETYRDTTLSVPLSADDDATRQIFLKKGSIVNLDIIGLQYNPRYFPEPEVFRPSRWYEQETSDIPDAVTTFNFGPRACIGRKFATTEAVCWLTMLLRDFRVEVPLLPGESREAARDRVLQARIVLTLQVDPVPIRLVRRSKE